MNSFQRFCLPHLSVKGETASNFHFSTHLILTKDKTKTRTIIVLLITNKHSHEKYRIEVESHVVKNQTTRH